MRGARKVQPLVAATACVAVSVLAILLWSKLKLVTGVPRSAYAEPKPRAVAGPQPRHTAAARPQVPTPTPASSGN